jgi:ATP-binding cassette subfamily B protein
MNYKLNTTQNENKKQKAGSVTALKKLYPFLQDEKWKLIFSTIAIIFSSLLSLFAPIIVAHVIDTYILTKRISGVVEFSYLLLAMFIVGAGTNYVQTRLMGAVGQRVLFKLRNAIFNKLQALPVSFFNQNKSGDLISRINNDTDNLNQFFSQSLVQFIGNVFMMVGAGIFLLALNIKLGAATLVPAVFLLVFTQLISPWVKNMNFVSLQALGNMSAEVQESIENFKVIVAFNRRGYFRQKFYEVNNTNYVTSVKAGLANNVFNPIYTFAANIGQLIVLTYGIYLVSIGQFSIGLLISFISYVSSFYNPLRQLANLWSNFQQALASWDRISEILAMSSNLKTIQDKTHSLPSEEKDKSLLEFKGVSFAYPDGQEVLHNINFKLKKGKTYAFVGPTGGGKSTTASLMARLYDPTKGEVLLNDRDIRSYKDEARTSKIGFILQEPLLFNGSVAENIRYSNDKLADFSDEQLEIELDNRGLKNLIARFDNGLKTTVFASGDSISLGQKQLIAFIRAVLRNPELLILDEATANIDTVTEKLLDEVLDQLPKDTTRVIIAHRLNTIENADEIFFVNAGEIVRAGSMTEAVDMLLHKDRTS